MGMPAHAPSYAAHGGMAVETTAPTYMEEMEDVAMTPHDAILDIDAANPDPTTVPDYAAEIYRFHRSEEVCFPARRRVCVCTSLAKPANG